MIIFQNKGLIPLEGVTIMGMSAKLENSFGMFGTGIKYSVATILRGGGEIVIYRGKQAHRFTTRPVTMFEGTDRAKGFEIVQLDGVDMGITTALGLNWKPWMVLREFGCNARDENGDFRSVDSWVNFQFIEGDQCNILQDDHTTVAIAWPALDDAFKHQGNLFVEGDPIFADADIRILPGVSSHLYYRGVRVFDLKKPSKVTYDILKTMVLTEDRTLYGDWQAIEMAAKAVLQLQDQEVLENILTCGEGFAEHAFDFKNAWGWDTKPSRQFLDVTITARARRDHKLSKSAVEVLGKKMRQTKGEESYGSGSYRRVVNDAYAYAIEILESVGIIDTETAPGVPEIMVVPVPDLPGEVQSMCEEGRIYILETLLHENALVIATELMPRFLELRCPTRDDVVDLLGPLLIKTHPQVAKHLKLVAEDAKLMAGEPAEAVPIEEVIAADETQ